MKSDAHAFMIFKNCPKLLQSFFRYNPEAEYEFSAPSEKEVRKSFDGLFVPKEASEPTFVIEFQMQYDPAIFVRLMMEMTIYQLANQERRAQGILILPKRVDLDTRLWSKLSEDCPWLVKVLYLNEVVEQDPLLKATFGLFVEPSDAVVEASIKDWYLTLHRSEYRNTLETVFFSWLFERFKDKGEEVHMWVQSLLDTDLEEIPYFRKLKESGITIGEERGEARGEARGITIGEVIGQIRLLQELKGISVDSKDTLLALNLESLRAKLDQLKSLPMGYS